MSPTRTYRVVLKSLHEQDEKIVLSGGITTRANAEELRRRWRRILGNKNWTIDRRPGLDSLDHLGLTIEEVR